MSRIQKNHSSKKLTRLQRQLQRSAGYNSLLWIITTPTPEERSSGHESWGPCPAVIFCSMEPCCLLCLLPHTPKNADFGVYDSWRWTHAARTEAQGLQFAPVLFAILILLSITTSFKQDEFVRFSISLCLPRQVPLLTKLTSDSERFDTSCG